VAGLHVYCTGAGRQGNEGV